MFKAQRRLRHQLAARRTVESKKAKQLENKEALLKAIDSNDIKALKNSALKTNDLMAWDDEGGEGIVSQEDDEYQWAGLEDPQVLITTSRDPSSCLKQFCKEITFLIPNSQRMNRGNTTIEMLTEKCLKEQVTDLILVEENRGVPDKLTISHFPHGPTVKFSLTDVVMRHQMNLESVSKDGKKGQHKMPMQYPNIVFKGLNTRLGIRLQSVLKYLFPVPKPDSKRMVCFLETEDVIKVCHYTSSIERDKATGSKTRMLQSHGPDFNMTVLKIFRGILQNEMISDIEYEYRPFMNTANKRRFLTQE